MPNHNSSHASRRPFNRTDAASTRVVRAGRPAVFLTKPRKHRKSHEAVLVIRAATLSDGSFCCFVKLPVLPQLREKYSRAVRADRCAPLLRRRPARVQAPQRAVDPLCRQLLLRAVLPQPLIQRRKIDPVQRLVLVEAGEHHRRARRSPDRSAAAGTARRPPSSCIASAS